MAIPSNLKPWYQQPKYIILIVLAVLTVGGVAIGVYFGVTSAKAGDKKDDVKREGNKDDKPREPERSESSEKESSDVEEDEEENGPVDPEDPAIKSALQALNPYEKYYKLSNQLHLEQPANDIQTILDAFKVFAAVPGAKKTLILTDQAEKKRHSLMIKLQKGQTGVELAAIWALPPGEVPVDKYKVILKFADVIHDSDPWLKARNPPAGSPIGGKKGPKTTTDPAVDKALKDLAPYAKYYKQANQLQLNGSVADTQDVLQAFKAFAAITGAQAALKLDATETQRLEQMIDLGKYYVAGMLHNVWLVVPGELPQDSIDYVGKHADVIDGAHAWLSAHYPPGGRPTIVVPPQVAQLVTFVKSATCQAMDNCPLPQAESEQLRQITSTKADFERLFEDAGKKAIAAHLYQTLKPLLQKHHKFKASPIHYQQLHDELQAARGKTLNTAYADAMLGQLVKPSEPPKTFEATDWSTEKIDLKDDKHRKLLMDVTDPAKAAVHGSCPALKPHVPTLKAAAEVCERIAKRPKDAELDPEDAIALMKVAKTSAIESFIDASSIEHFVITERRKDLDKKQHVYDECKRQAVNKLIEGVKGTKTADQNRQELVEDVEKALTDAADASTTVVGHLATTADPVHSLNVFTRSVERTLTAIKDEPSAQEAIKALRNLALVSLIDQHLSKQTNYVQSNLALIEQLAGAFGKLMTDLDVSAKDLDDRESIGRSSDWDRHSRALAKLMRLKAVCNGAGWALPASPNVEAKKAIDAAQARLAKAFLAVDAYWTVPACAIVAGPGPNFWAWDPQADMFAPKDAEDEWTGLKAYIEGGLGGLPPINNLEGAKQRVPLGISRFLLNAFANWENKFSSNMRDFVGVME